MSVLPANHADGTEVIAASIINDIATQINANTAAIAAGSPPSGSAGGSLAGSYPNPTLGPGVATGAVLGSDVAKTSAGRFGGAIAFPTVRNWGLGWATASGTAVKIEILVTGGTSCAVNVQLNGVTNLLTSPVTVTASASPTIITTINNSTVTTGDHAVLVISAVTGSVTDLEIQVTTA